MNKILISTFIGFFLFAINCNAQNTKKRLLVSDTSWLSNTELYIHNYNSLSYNVNSNQWQSSPQKYVSFVGTNKVLSSTERKLAYYYKKSPEAFTLYTKAKILKHAGNFALLSPYPILLVTKELTGQKYFWDSNIIPIAIYAVTSFIIFRVCKKESKHFGYSAVPIYNRSLGSKYELHK